MDYNKYIDFCKKAYELQKKNFELFEEQTKLSYISKQKAEAFYKIQDEVTELYKKAVEKIKNKVPKDWFSADNTRLENLLKFADKYVKGSKEVNETIELLNSIPEFVEAGELEKKRQVRFFEYSMAHLELDWNINEHKKKLFTAEYLKKMDEYADDGILLYFMETPDYPILDKNVTHQLFLDALLFGDCDALKTLYYSFITCPSPGISMQRKIKDVKDVINNLINGCYRTAARTMFALMESEIKNISTSLEEFFEQEKKYKNNKERSQKIEELTKYMDMPNAKRNWEKINKYYEKIVTGTDPMIDRNVIVHGDYREDSIDIDEYDVVKLMLLYLSLRMHGDYIQNHVAIYKEALTYYFLGLAHELKNQID